MREALEGIGYVYGPWAHMCCNASQRLLSYYLKKIMAIGFLWLFFH